MVTIRVSNVCEAVAFCRSRKGCLTWQGRGLEVLKVPGLEANAGGELYKPPSQSVDGLPVDVPPAVCVHNASSASVQHRKYVEMHVICHAFQP